MHEFSSGISFLQNVRREHLFALSFGSIKYIVVSLRLLYTSFEIIASNY